MPNAQALRSHRRPKRARRSATRARIGTRRSRLLRDQRLRVLALLRYVQSHESTPSYVHTPTVTWPILVETPTENWRALQSRRSWSVALKTKSRRRVAWGWPYEDSNTRRLRRERRLERLLPARATTHVDPPSIPFARQFTRCLGPRSLSWKERLDSAKWLVNGSDDHARSREHVREYVTKPSPSPSL